jgi:hypothetical protein
MFRYIADDVLSLIIQNLVIMLITSIAYKETNNSLRNQLTYTNIIHPPLDFLYNFVQQYVIFKVLKEYCIPKEERKKLPIFQFYKVCFILFLLHLCIRGHMCILWKTYKQFETEFDVLINLQLQRFFMSFYTFF